MKIGTISGKIIDATTGQPVEFANVVLSRRSKKDPAKDSIVAGVITETNGEFSFTKLFPGRYKLKVGFIGYKNFEKDSLLVTMKAPVLALGQVKIQANTEVLKDVDVIGEKDQMQMNIDKKVYNVEKDIVSTGGNASDVLNNIPSVTVDVDGTVNLRGNANVTILIDGKPSAMLGSGPEVLRSIPSNLIERVEVITNPSVKYDPDGISGIINIVLKKDQKGGLNGTVSLSAGTNNKYNGSFNLNYRRKKWLLFGSYSPRYDTRTSGGYTNQKSFFTDTSFYYNSVSDNEGLNFSQTGRFGFDYYINPKHVIGFTSSFNLRDNEGDEIVKYDFLDENSILTSSNERRNLSERFEKSLDLGVNFRKTYDVTGHEWTADVSWSGNAEEEFTDNIQKTYLPDGTISGEFPWMQESFDDRVNTVFTFQTDYVKPNPEKKSSFELGAKTIIRNVDYTKDAFTYDSASFNWQVDSTLTSEYSFNEQIFSAYSAYAGMIKNLGYKVGLRLEEALTRFSLATTDEKFFNDYFSLFPSLHLSRKIKDIHEIQLSYSRRVNRPSVRSMNPFPDLSDPLNIRVGNPYLKPEYFNSIDLSYIRLWKKTTLSSSVYYRRTDNMIQRYKVVDPNGVSTTTFQNYASAENLGAEMNVRTRPLKWLSLMYNVNFYQTKTIGPEISGELTSVGTNWNTRISADISLPKDIRLQLSGFYRAPMVIINGHMNAMYSADMGARWDFMKKKASLALSWSDVFDTRKMSMHLEDVSYQQDFERRWESSYVMLTFSYRFGIQESNMNRKKDKKPEFETPDMDF